MDPARPSLGALDAGEDGVGAHPGAAEKRPNHSSLTYPSGIMLEKLRERGAEGASFSVAPGGSGDWEDEFLKLPPSEEGGEENQLAEAQLALATGGAGKEAAVKKQKSAEEALVPFDERTVTVKRINRKFGLEVGSDNVVTVRQWSACPLHSQGAEKWVPEPPQLNVTAVEMEKALTAFDRLARHQKRRLADLEDQLAGAEED